MGAEEIASLVNSELLRIPTGDLGSPQQMLRVIYHIMRCVGLARNPNEPRAQAFTKSVAALRRRFADFEPALSDPEYFGWTG